MVLPMMSYLGGGRVLGSANQLCEVSERLHCQVGLRQVTDSRGRV
jgi:hypothetical protein